MPANNKTRADLHNEPEYCVTCSTQITDEKRLARRAVTCSEECYKKRVAVQRSKRDQKECRYCKKPSTQADRILYARWRGFAQRGQLIAALLRELMGGMDEADKRRRKLDPLASLLETQWDAQRESMADEELPMVRARSPRAPAGITLSLLRDLRRALDKDDDRRKKLDSIIEAMEADKQADVRVASEDPAAAELEHNAEEPWHGKPLPEKDEAAA